MGAPHVGDGELSCHPRWLTFNGLREQSGERRRAAAAPPGWRCCRRRMCCRLSPCRTRWRIPGRGGLCASADAEAIEALASAGAGLRRWWLERREGWRRTCQWRRCATIPPMSRYVLRSEMRPSLRQRLFRLRPPSAPPRATMDPEAHLTAPRIFGRAQRQVLAHSPGMSVVFRRAGWPRRQPQRAEGICRRAHVGSVSVPRLFGAGEDARLAARGAHP